MQMVYSATLTEDIEIHVKTTFFVIRHGETDWNLNGRWQGHADVPLNQVGRVQARRLADRLLRDGARIDAIYSSDLKRAWETARAVAAALDLAPRLDPSLREIDVGSWSMAGVKAQSLHIGNTSITVLTHGQDGWQLGRINDMSHLEASPQAPDMMSAPPDDTERP